ncbi:hypothetical protein HMPREF0973_01436 [Prevotella veroralis F0319]|uniref:Uncharacterized protein n=1 Tax=Prevotella veroralis F0319 TaxID=649761 RepID=C9MP98_9BACT|nr:hypothetical protein HMPREF0973_01436 [Prevotella veroralis F0319]
MKERKGVKTSVKRLDVFQSTIPRIGIVALYILNLPSRTFVLTPFHSLILGTLD